MESVRIQQALSFAEQPPVRMPISLERGLGGLLMKLRGCSRPIGQTGSVDANVLAEHGKRFFV